MQWSYSGDPATSNLDMVRFLIGDTDYSDQQLGDPEINAALVTCGANVYRTAIFCVGGLIGKFSRLCSKSMGDLQISYSDVVKNYKELLRRLQAQASAQAVAPYAGGISVVDKQVDEEDTDRVAPAFYTGMHDYPGSGTE